MWFVIYGPNTGGRIGSLPLADKAAFLEQFHVLTLQVDSDGTEHVEVLAERK